MSPLIRSVGLRRGGAFTPPTPPAIVPTDLANLVLWLDAADATTITESSGAVSEWRDKSGNAHHATQATPDRQPTLVPAALNGKSVVRFDGSDMLSLLSTSALDMARNVPGFTAIAVVSSSDSATQRMFHINTPDPSHQARFTIYKSSTGGVGGCAVRRLDAHTSAAATSAATIGATHAILSGIADFAGGSVTVRVNGADEGSASPTSTGNSSDTRSSQVRVGAVTSTSNPSGEAFLTGDIAELICYQRALTPTERGQVEAYLAEKWGISI